MLCRLDPRREVAYNLRFPGQYYQAETGVNQNWNREYDPIVGRYVESDLIGLHGGVNTYAYVTSDPVDDVDPLGLLNRGNHVTDAQWQTIQQAEAKIRQELSKSCSCHMNSSADGCIPCDKIGNLLSRLNGSTVDVGHVSSSECGIAPILGWGIWLSPDAFTGKGCKCFASILYHELLHNAGTYDEDMPGDPGTYTLQRRCMGNLCGKGP